MNFFWLYDLSIWVLYIIVFVTFSSFSVFGYLFAKKPLTKYFHSRDIEINDVISHFTGIIGIFFGILIGLVAVGVWENYNSSQEKVDAESGNALALYRECSGLPFQVSKVIKEDIKIYLNNVVKKEWPQSKKGNIPLAALNDFNKIQQDLLLFNPITEKDKIIYKLCLDKFSVLASSRRERVYATQNGLPPIVWAVTIIGCIVLISISWFFDTDTRLHIIMSLIVGILLSTVIFMIISLDWPFRGSLSIDTGSYKFVLDRIRDTELKQNLFQLTN
jgi:hypothetical protein